MAWEANRNSQKLFPFYKQEGHEALNRSSEYTGQIQTFNFEIWMTFDQGQRMTMTFDTHSTSFTHLAECFKELWDLRLQQFPKKITFSHTKAYETKFNLGVK